MFRNFIRASRPGDTFLASLVVVSRTDSGRFGEDVVDRAGDRRWKDGEAATSSTGTVEEGAPGGDWAGVVVVFIGHAKGRAQRSIRCRE